MSLLEVRDLVKHFPVRQGALRAGSGDVICAVDGISFAVQEGETLGLVGETGCGKSTTARLLMLLLKPTSGSIELDGVDVTRLSGRETLRLRREMQMVFQDPYSSLNPRKTIGSIIAEPLIVHRVEPDARSRRRAVQDVMELVGLNPEHYNRYPHEFSGGQRQRVGIARAIVLRPKVLIADEPVSALDVSIQAQILNLLSDLRRELGLTMIFIAHDLSVVRHVCDHVAVMYLGQIIELARAEDFFAHPRHPYSQALLSAVPVPDPDAAREQRRVALSGDVPSPRNPPVACRFRSRCFARQDVCAREEPLLEAREGPGEVACHFPRDGDRDAAAQASSS